jgi:hypothetical protein
LFLFLPFFSSSIVFFQDCAIDPIIGPGGERPMARRIRKRKCLNCSIFFLADPRNVKRQQFCSKPECRKASKAASQRRWLQKSENQDYFRGPHNVRRVQQWRQDYPGYWRRKSSRKKEPLQDSLSEKTVKKQSVTIPLASNALQEVLSSQHIVLIGLIAQLSGTALQDDIAFTARRLRQLGHDVLNSPTQSKGGHYD